jgi:hypothetical protein
MTGLKIPFDQLSLKALRGVVEEFVTRDGTDYGEVETPLEIKMNQVLDQLKSGKAVIVFDPESETCNILKSNDPLLKLLDKDRP